MFHVEEAGEALGDNLVHASVELVGENAQLATPTAQLGERFGDVRVGRGQVVVVFQVEALPACNCLVGYVFRGVLGHRLAHERDEPVAHEAQNLVVRSLGKSLLAKGLVSDNDQIGQRVQNGAVEVEDEGVE